MPYLRRGVHIASKQLAYLLLFFSVIVLLLLGSLYWLSSEIEQRQDEIATWLSNKIEQPVTIGAADIELLSFMPKLHIDNIQIWSKQSDFIVMNLDTLYLGLDVISSVQQSEPVLSDVAINGLDAELIRSEHGELAIKGLEFSADKDSTNTTDWFAWLSRLSQIELQGINITYADVQKPYLSGQYSLVNAYLEHDDSEWLSQASIQLPSSLGKTVTLQANANIEDSWSNSVWTAQIDTQKLALTELADDLIGQYITVQQGKTDVNVSVQGQGSQVAQVVSSIQLSQLKLASVQSAQKSVAPPVTIEHLNTTISWLQADDGWQLSGQKLVLEMNGELWPETDFKFSQQAEEWSFSSPYIKLSDLSSIALLFEDSPEIIKQQKPAGDLENLALNYSDKSGLKSLVFDLKEGAFLAWQTYPGMSGLTMSVNWHDGLADIGLDSHKLHIYADNWLDKAIFFDSVTGNISVQNDDSSLSIQSQAVRIWNDDLTVQLDGHLEHFATGKTISDLQVSLEEVKVNTWQKYVPQKILDPDFKEWSAGAFVNGVITNGKIALVGDLADFPYDPDTDKGHFKMDLTVEDMQLHYAPDWPDIKGVNGSVKGLGNDLVIKSQHGTIAGFQFVDVTTTIKRLMITKPVLTVEGSLTGSTNQALDFVRISPLKQRFAAAVKGMKAKGNSDINLQLLVPLTNVNSTTANGFVRFKNSELHYQTVPEVAATKINGVLNFDGNGVDTKEDITASLLGEPVSVSVKPSNDNTAVTMNGRLTTKAINAVWPNSLPSYIQGQTSYTARLNVKEKQLGDFYIDGDVFADLHGLTVNMPAPFAKTAEQNVNFAVSMNMIKDKPHYSLNYSDVLKAAFTANNDKWKAGIVIGKGTPKLPKRGIQVSSNLEQLSVDDWLNWIDSQPKSSNSGNDLVSQVEQLNIALKTKSLTAFDYTLTNLDTVIDKQAQGWQIQLQSEQAVGNIYVPDDLNSAKKLAINLDKLTIDIPEQSNHNKQSSSLWPAMNVSIASLKVDGAQLGEFKLDADTANNKWFVKSASLKADQFSVIANSAEWSKNKTGDATQVDFQLHSEDLGSALAQLGYQRAIEAEQVNISSQSKWNASPLDFSMQLLQGQANFTVGKGKLNDVEPGAAGRVFGLMSVAALPRRLALDFSDLFAKGFNFDSISGSFQIDKGMARTDDFALIGPSAKVEISGGTDLVEQHYDQTVKITPNVSSTLPLAGAVAGGPVGLGVGAAILLVDKLSGSLFGKNIVNVISYKYALTGPWDDPEFKVLLSPSP